MKEALVVQRVGGESEDEKIVVVEANVAVDK